MLKKKLELEKYFKKLNDRNIKTLCRFRTSNHKLPTEMCMWQNIARENRKCLLCNFGDIGDQFQYIFSCSKNDDNHNLLIRQILEIDQAH
jgi:hypothetical protein